MTKSTITREQAQQIIDAADEVITALAGTNDEVHKDDTYKMVRLWDDLNDRHAPPEVVRELARMALSAMGSEPVAIVEPSDYVTAAQLVGEGPARKAVHEMYEGALRIGDKLYRHAQPALDGEPVAWKYEEYVYVSGLGHLWREKLDCEFPGIECGTLRGVVPLYRHAQQPVVPDESYQQLSDLYHAQEKRLFKIAQRIKGPAFDKYSHSASQAIDVLECAIFGENDACRAAMLNGGKS